jgi:hypothetical protein
MSVSEAMDTYLAGRGFDGRDVVLAEVARVLASQLEAACESGTARGLSAVPPIASRLVEVLAALEGETGDRNSKPSREDLARLLAPLRETR